MMKMIRIILLGCLVFAAGCASARAPSAVEVTEYSMIALIAEPEKYHNRRIRTRGFAQVEFENTALYLSENDAKNYISKNALWLTPEVVGHQNLHAKYVVVEGTFDATMHGHFGQFSGTIKDIGRFEANVE